MKKHMKKVLALLLCALMIIPAALPVLAVYGEPAAQATTNAGPLAITEVMPRSTTEGYSYIEILNTSDADIDLSNYYLYMITFSNGAGMYYASSAEQLLGLSNSQDVFAIKLNGTVNAHDVVVVMVSDKYDKSDFITYWNGLGTNLTKDNVIDIDVTTTYNVSSVNGGATYDSTQKNFLPRNTHFTFSLSIITASKAKDVNGDLISGEKYHYNGDHTEAGKKPTRQILEGADCIVLFNPYYTEAVTGPANLNPTGVSAHFSAFIEKESYNKAVDATVYPDVVTNKKNYYYDDLYPSLAVSDPNLPFEVMMDLTTAYKYAEGGSKGVALPKLIRDCPPTPGRLYDVQYGHSEQGGPLAITEVCAAQDPDRLNRRLRVKYSVT